MRNAKRFVQIQMTNVGAVIARTAEAALRVHVRAVHVNLAAVRVYDVADLADCWFEHAVRGRIRHHECGKIARVLVRFRAQIGNIDISIFQTGNRDNFESSHHCAGWIRAVRRGRNETNVAMRFPARCVILVNGEQTCEFTLRSGVGLQGYGCETGDFGKPFFQLLKNFHVACCLFDGRERMHLGNFRP